MKSPFNEAHYRALLEGLEVAEISLSELENQMTIGAEYYAPTLLDAFARIVDSGIPTKLLSECCSLITDGDHGSADYQETGVPFILSEAVNEGWLSTNKFRFISESHSATLQRSELHPGDVLLTKTGIYFGKSAVLPNSIPVANTIAHVAKLVVKKSVNPYYLSTFFNSTYGYLQLRRRGIKATRPEMKLVEMQDILIPLPSAAFQVAIEQLIKRGLQVNDDQERFYKQAETLLFDALHLNDWQPPTPLTYEQPASTAFTAGRLDAEHYQPQYTALLAHLKQYAPHLRKVRDFAAKNERGIQPIYTEDGPISVINSKHILETSLDYDNFERTDINVPAARVKQYDILMYTTGANIGRTATYLDTTPAIASNHVNVLRLREENPVYVAVVLNSRIGRMQTRQNCAGSAQVEIYPGDIANFTVPFVADDIQRDITEQVEAAHTARRKAKQLLEAAKRAVEIAIEEGEEAGLNYLNQFHHA